MKSYRVSWVAHACEALLGFWSFCIQNSVPNSRALSAKLDRNSDFWAALIGILDRRGNYSGLRPSASNCRPHSVGGSRPPFDPPIHPRQKPSDAIEQVGLECPF